MKMDSHTEAAMDMCDQLRGNLERAFRERARSVRAMERAERIAGALMRMIDIHCRGELIPAAVAEPLPQFADRLNSCCRCSCEDVKP